MPNPSNEEFLKTIETLAETKNREVYEKALMQVRQYIEANKENPDALNVKTQWGDTLLTIAARRGMIDVIKMMLNLDIASQLINVPDSRGVSPLISVILANVLTQQMDSKTQSEIIKLLLKGNGIDVNKRSEGMVCDNTALFYAAVNGNLVAVTLLLEHNEALDDWKKHPQNLRAVTKSVYQHKQAVKTTDQQEIAARFIEIENLLVIPFQKNINIKLPHQEVQEEIDKLADNEKEAKKNALKEGKEPELPIFENLKAKPPDEKVSPIHENKNLTQSTTPSYGDQAVSPTPSYGDQAVSPPGISKQASKTSFSSHGFLSHEELTQTKVKNDPSFPSQEAEDNAPKNKSHSPRGG